MLSHRKMYFLDAVHLAHKNEAHPFWDAPINRFETSLKKRGLGSRWHPFPSRILIFIKVLQSFEYIHPLVSGGLPGCRWSRRRIPPWFSCLRPLLLEFQQNIFKDHTMLWGKRQAFWPPTEDVRVSLSPAGFIGRGNCAEPRFNPMMAQRRAVKLFRKRRRHPPKGFLDPAALPDSRVRQASSE